MSGCGLPPNLARGFAARRPLSPVAHADGSRWDDHLDIFIAGEPIFHQDVDYRPLFWDADSRRETVARMRLDWHIAIRTPASPRTCAWWRPSVARLPGPRRARSWAGSPVQQVAPGRCERHDHTAGASGPQTSARSRADGPTEQTGLKLRPAPTPLVLAPQTGWRDSSM